MSPLLEVNHVSKSFGGVQANQDISMQVADGEIVGIIGPNGSGKTTLFNSIVGYHPIDQGSIKFRDEELSSLRVPHIARRGLLRTFQQTRIYKQMTCVENMLISRPHANETLGSMLADFDQAATDTPCGVPQPSSWHGTHRAACVTTWSRCSKPRPPPKASHSRRRCPQHPY